MVLTVSFALSLVTGLSCHHRPRPLPANLTPASGRQDHTTSPSAPVSTKAARRSWYRSRRSFSEGGSASLVLRRRRVHRIPHPTSVTIAKRPSCEAGCAKDAGDLGEARSEIFFATRLDRWNRVDAVQ